MEVKLRDRHFASARVMNRPAMIISRILLNTPKGWWKMLHRDLSRRFALLVSFLAILALLSSAAFAQTTISTGSIVGTVTDASGAVVPNAKVTITGPTGQTINAITNGQGAYSAGNLVPGHYKVRVEAKGFKTAQLTSLEVKVESTANGSIKLELGLENTVVDVQASEVQINTEQATVQGVLMADQIENLPVNGRNFLDLAQLEPGVQIQDGQNFDPTKAGFSSISFGGRYGRTARIEVDGVDVSDETVGTTTMDIPASGIQEFSLGQASLDMSTELTSSGSVNVVTKSGTNAYHGEAFGQFRDSTIGAAALPGGAQPPYQRSQYGGDLGGPIMKDKLFFFADGERTKQDTQAPVLISAPFQQYSGNFNAPFREDNLMARVDYQLKPSARLFYRFNYFKNFLAATFGFGYSVYDNENITRTHLIGLDFNHGQFTHAFRFSYLKFENQIVDATSNNPSLPFYNLGAEIFMGATGLAAGPNWLAPQATPQGNHELKYDGTRVFPGNHILRFGVAYDNVASGGFASFYKNGPSITSAVTTADIGIAAGGPFPGGASNPLNYPADGGYVLGNGLGYGTTKAGLGFPAGEYGPDNRILLYVGDSWKMRPNFNLTLGLRYERDTARTDSQFPAIPELDSLIGGLGNRVAQPNKNFAPQIGFAWDPGKNAKTVIRGGIGLYYENAVFNNVEFDAPERELTGAFLQTPSPCAAAGTPSPIQTSTGVITASSGTPTSVCGTSSSYPLIGNALPALLALQAQYQAASPLNLQQSNPNYAGQYLTDCAGGTNCYFYPSPDMFNPNYRSPRSVVMNLGFQREIKPGVVLSADFIRNVQTHYLLGVDLNHAGDVKTFNVSNALQAITQTNQQFNCPAGPSGVDCAISAGATMANYAANGLGSSTDMGGNSCLAALGYNCAFPGMNPIAPSLPFLSPVGRSVYNGLQTKLVENVKHPFQYVEGMNLQVSYSFSRFDNDGGAVPPDSPVTASANDQDFIIPALDNDNVHRYFGPSTLDRTHQVSFGGYAEMRWGFQIGLMSHFYSPLSTTLTVPNTGLGAGEIFRTDFDGDGTTQDPIPGTHVGSFGRGVDNSSLTKVISKYDTTVAGLPTPAGEALINANLMSQQQLSELGAVAPYVQPPVAGQVNMSWLKALDTTVSWSHTFFDRITIKPSVGFYNVFNFANFDLPTSMMSGLLTGTPGSVNGTTYLGHQVNRVGVGTGVYTLGSPREAEFSLKVIF